MARTNSFHKISVGRRGNSSATADDRSARREMNNIIRKYEKFIEQVENATPQIIFDALEPTFDKSWKYCPYDTGDLRNSGYLIVLPEGNKPKVEMGYGYGGKPGYAARVHENLEWQHKAPTRAKWLQVALEEDMKDFLPRIVKKLKV